MSEGLKKYLKIQISLGKITKKSVLKKYPEMEDYLED